MTKSFIWQIDPTPAWFSKDYSYRYDLATKSIELPTADGNRIVTPGELITEGLGGFFIIGDATGAKTPDYNPNRAARRKSLNTDERLTVGAIIVEFTNGQTVHLDTEKVMIIDKDTKAQLFQYVIEGKSK